MPELIERKPGLGNEGRATPVRDQPIRVCDEIDASTRPSIWIARKDEAVFLRQIAVVIAQIEVEGLVGEGHACLPVEIGRQRKAAELRSLIAEPGKQP